MKYVIWITYVCNWRHEGSCSKQWYTLTILHVLRLALGSASSRDICYIVLGCLKYPISVVLLCTYFHFSQLWAVWHQRAVKGHFFAHVLHVGIQPIWHVNNMTYLLQKYPTDPSKEICIPVHSIWESNLLWALTSQAVGTSLDTPTLWPVTTVLSFLLVELVGILHCWLDYDEERLSRLHTIWCSVHIMYQCCPGTGFW